MILRTFCVWLSFAGSAVADGLSFPSNAELTFEETRPLDSFDLPVGAWKDGAVPFVRHEGRLTRQAWRINAGGLSTLQILRPLREQIRQAGLTTIFECDTAACGGFDFRFARDVVLPPAMQVNLRDFRFLAAEAPGQALAVLVSQNGGAGFVQVTWITDAEAPAPEIDQTAPRARTLTGAETTDLETALDTIGRYVLSDVAFETGSAQLISGDIASLAALSDYLAAYPDRTVALVGHTDAAGSLDGNIALSRRRAGSVLERLVSAFGVPRSQLEAQGMGYLAPIANNLTEDGRALNRRVEVIITSTR